MQKHTSAEQELGVATRNKGGNQEQGHAIAWIILTSSLLSVWRFLFRTGEGSREETSRELGSLASTGDRLPRLVSTYGPLPQPWLKYVINRGEVGFMLDSHTDGYSHILGTVNKLQVAVF